MVTLYLFICIKMFLVTEVKSLTPVGVLMQLLYWYIIHQMLDFNYVVSDIFSMIDK